MLILFNNPRVIAILKGKVSFPHRCKDKVLLRTKYSCTMDTNINSILLHVTVYGLCICQQHHHFTLISIRRKHLFLYFKIEWSHSVQTTMKCKWFSESRATELLPGEIFWLGNKEILISPGIPVSYCTGRLDS